MCIQMNVFDAMKIEDFQKAKEDLMSSGISIASWAKANGFSSALVYQVLDGKRSCLRGESFKIAQKLGLIDMPDSSRRFVN